MAPAGLDVDMIPGFDAAAWAGNIDMPAAYKAGMRFCWLRVARGHDDTSTDPAPAGIGTDPTWPGRRADAEAAGIIPGGYMRFAPDVDLNTQVGIFASRLRQADGMLPPLVDIEDAAGIPTAPLTDWTRNCLHAVHQATGRRPILYTGQNFYTASLRPHLLDRWELCIANWSASSWPTHAAVFWQHKGDVTVPWASGRVDLQRFACRDAYLQYHRTPNDLLYWFDDAGWLHGPRADRRPLPESGDQGSSTARVGCAHTMVGYLRGTESYFARGDVSVESHFGVGGRYDDSTLDGALWQWMSTNERADANLEGNGYITSWETSDGGGSRYLERWTSAQAEVIAQSMAAWCLHYNRPASLVPDSCNTRQGLSYHRQGVNPWRAAACDAWSASNGKVCPGDTRIKQYTGETIPRIRKILASLTLGADDMPLTDADAEKVAGKLREILGLGPGQRFDLAIYGQGTNQQVFKKITATNEPQSIVARLAAVADDVNAVRDGMPSGPGLLEVLNRMETAAGLQHEQLLAAIQALADRLPPNPA